MKNCSVMNKLFLGIIALSFVLMGCGESDNKNALNGKKVFSMFLYKRVSYYGICKLA